MYARNASIFKSIDIADNASEDITSSLQTINEFIEFINQFRYRSSLPFGDDIEQREHLVKWLTDAEQQEALKKQVFVYWYEQHMPIEKIREKEQFIKNIFDNFKQYSRFAHLTATELAVITIAIQKLIVFLQLTQKQIKDVITQEAIRNKLNELVESQDAIYACMQKHQEIFNKNKLLLEDQHDLPANDILLAVLQEVDVLTGAGYIKNWPLKPDDSMLFAIPDLPFGEVDEAKTAKHYFEACHAAQLAGKKWSKRAGGALGKAGEWTGWCLQGAWSLTSTVVTAPIKLVGGGVGMWKPSQTATPVVPLKKEEINIEESREPWVLIDNPQPEPDERLDALTNDLHSYVEKMTELVNKELESLERSEELIRWKNKINAAIKLLETELEKCMSSCFSFFMLSTIATKEMKVNALKDLLPAKDLSELQQRTTAQMECADKNKILAGRASRTKKLLKEILSIEIDEGIHPDMPHGSRGQAAG